MTLKIRLLALGTGIALSLLLNALNLHAVSVKKTTPHSMAAHSLHHF